MLTFRKWMNTRTNRAEDGFSLLELVVAVGIILVLSVGGFIAYQGITENSRVAAVERAAATTYTAASAAEASEGTWSSIEKVQGDWNDSAGNNTEVEITRDADGRICVVASFVGGKTSHVGTRGSGGECGALDTIRASLMGLFVFERDEWGSGATRGGFTVINLDTGEIVGTHENNIGHGGLYHFGWYDDVNSSITSDTLSDYRIQFYLESGETWDFEITEFREEWRTETATSQQHGTWTFHRDGTVSRTEAP